MKRNLWHDYVKSASHHKNTCHLVAEYASQKLSRYVGEQCWWWPPAGWTGQDIQKRPGLSSVGLRCCSPGRIPLCLLSRPSLQLRTAWALTGHLQNAKCGGNYSFKRSVGLLSLVTLTHSEEEEELRKILQGVLVRSLDTVENCTVLAVHLWILNPIFLASLK